MTYGSGKTDKFDNDYAACPHPTYQQVLIRLAIRKTSHTYFKTCIAYQDRVWRLTQFVHTEVRSGRSYVKRHTFHSAGHAEVSHDPWNFSADSPLRPDFQNSADLKTRRQTNVEQQSNLATWILDTVHIRNFFCIAIYSFLYH